MPVSASKENNAPVNDVRVIVSWRWGKYCGVSKTYGIPVNHVNYTRYKELTNKITLEFAEYSSSWNQVEISIGVAAINSMIKRGENRHQCPGFNHGNGEKVVMVGKFPKVDEIRAISQNYGF